MIRCLMTLLMVPLVLVGCGKTSEQKVDDTNSRIATMNSINTSVATSYGVVMIAKSWVSQSRVDGINSDAVAKLSKSELLALRAKVNEFDQNAREALEIVKSGGVTLYGSSEIETARGNVRYILSRIAQELATLDAKPIVGAAAEADLAS